MADARDMPLLCHRCGAELTPGEGNFYVVNIEAIADPSPPNISTDELLYIDIDAEIRKILDQVRDMPESDLRDQVYRRLTIHLCGSCYADWIENPAGP
ncbi:MAG: hypothetical protein SVT52_04705 [Planctomycetota bacterium]|nr:hypothetical protein [Planctomycetota bacterium]